MREPYRHYNLCVCLCKTIRRWTFLSLHTHEQWTVPGSGRSTVVETVKIVISIIFLPRRLFFPRLDSHGLYTDETRRQGAHCKTACVFEGPWSISNIHMGHVTDESEKDGVEGCEKAEEK